MEIFRDKTYKGKTFKHIYKNKNNENDVCDSLSESFSPFQVYRASTSPFQGMLPSKLCEISIMSPF